MASYIKGRLNAEKWELVVTFKQVTGRDINRMEANNPSALLLLHYNRGLKPQNEGETRAEESRRGVVFWRHTAEFQCTLYPKKPGSYQKKLLKLQLFEVERGKRTPFCKPVAIDLAKYLCATEREYAFPLSDGSCRIHLLIQAKRLRVNDGESGSVSDGTTDSQISCASGVTQESADAENLRGSPGRRDGRRSPDRRSDSPPPRRRRDSRSPSYDDDDSSYRRRSRSPPRRRRDSRSPRSSPTRSDDYSRSRTPSPRGSYRDDRSSDRGRYYSKPGGTAGVLADVFGPSAMNMDELIQLNAPEIAAKRLATKEEVRRLKSELKEVARALQEERGEKERLQYEWSRKNEELSRALQEKQEYYETAQKMLMKERLMQRPPPPAPRRGANCDCTIL